MENWSCAFFGHRAFDYEPYRHKLQALVENLIKQGVTHFYNGFRGDFDTFNANLVNEMRKAYPYIKNILVLSYKPKENFVLPVCFDEAVYLQDNDVPPKYAIWNTNRKLVQSVDFIISGVVRCGGAKMTCDYAKSALKSMYNAVTDEHQFWYVSPIEIEDTMRQHEEKMKTDEEYRRKHYEEVQKLIEIAKKYTKKPQKRKLKDYDPPVWVTVDTDKRTR